MTDTRSQALSSLALFAKGIIPSRIGAHDFEPSRTDSIDLQNDLLIIADKADAVFLSYGVRLHEAGIISAHDVRDHFTDVVRNAITGNALFCIEAGIQERINERAA
jgi:hypothetical protein